MMFCLTMVVLTFSFIYDNFYCFYISIIVISINREYSQMFHNVFSPMVIYYAQVEIAIQMVFQQSAFCASQYFFTCLLSKRIKHSRFLPLYPLPTCLKTKKYSGKLQSVRDIWGINLLPSNFSRAEKSLQEFEKKKKTIFT